MTVLEAYTGAWRRRNVLVPVMLGLRLLTIALVAPAAAALVDLAVRLSGQSALTDQAIAGAIASPLGFPVFLLVASALMVASVIGLAAMTVDLHRGGGGLAALRGGLHLIARRLPRLMGYAVALLLRVLAIVLPCALAILLLVQRLIGDYDINYYLGARPPEFVAAVTVGGVLAAVMTGLLVWKLLGWAVSLHLVLFDDMSPRAGFAESRIRMAGRRMSLLRDLAIWLLLRISVAALLGAVFGSALGLAPALLGGGVERQLTAALILAVLWALGGLVVAALSLGALARLLDAYHGGTGTLPSAEPDTTSARWARLPVLAAGAGLLILGGVLATDRMLDRVDTDRDVEVIGHRGAALLKPENTMAAIERAVADGADWVEIDVQETAEGDVVVMHDSDFMKLSGDPLKIWDATRPDLERLDIGSWFDTAYATERVPTLEQALEATRNRAGLLIELKYYGHDEALETRVIEIVETADMTDQVAVMSLKYPAVQKMRTLRPDWRAGVLAATAIGDLAALDADFVAVNTGLAGPRLLRSAHARGKQVYVWTVNDPVQMVALVSMGVDGLITDDPALARQVLAEYAALSPAERLFALLLQRMGLTGWAPGAEGDGSP